MKHYQQTVERLTAGPFQVSLPQELVGASADGYFTLKATLWKGICGVEGELPLFVYERGQAWESTGGPAWWACFGFSIVPNGSASELRLFYLDNTFFDQPHQIVARWHGQAALPLVNNPDAEYDLDAAWQVVKQLLAEQFPVREIDNPIAQIPGYRHQDHAIIFGSP